MQKFGKKCEIFGRFAYVKLKFFILCGGIFMSGEKFSNQIPMGKKSILRNKSLKLELKKVQLGFLINCGVLMQSLHVAP